MGDVIRRRAATAPGIAIRVFLADGDDYCRAALRELLQGHDGIEVVGECPDPVRAAAEARRARPDVVIHSASTGYADAAREEALVGALAASGRVILLSPHATPEHVLHAIGAGARGYLLDCCAAEEIVEAVRAVRGGRTYLGRRIVDLLAKEYLRAPRAHAHAP